SDTIAHGHPAKRLRLSRVGSPHLDRLLADLELDVAHYAVLALDALQIFQIAAGVRAGDGVVLEHDEVDDIRLGVLVTRRFEARIEAPRKVELHRKAIARQSVGAGRALVGAGHRLVGDHELDPVTVTGGRGRSKIDVERDRAGPTGEVEWLPG